jgi:hypothetical protein
MMKIVDSIIGIGLVLIVVILMSNCEDFVKNAHADDCDDVFMASIAEECAKPWFHCTDKDEGEIMPYTPAQCRLFAAKKKRGEKVPDDWKAHCKKKKKKKDK